MSDLMMGLDLSVLPERLLVGTSSFSSPDWCGSFYPRKLQPAEYLGHYATRLRTVEIDATWHAMPARRTVEAWERKVPPGFVFSAKVPRGITHDSRLEDCEEEWDRFLSVMDALGDKRGPILFQFPYVARGADPEECRTGTDFLRRLERFLPLIPREGRFAVEVRNPSWIAPPLLDLLRSRGIALVLVAYYTMPTAADLMSRLDPVTADFAYIRFLGNHRAMDHSVSQARERGERSRDWGELLVDRTTETRQWIPPVRALLDRVKDVFIYFNNHYAGFAPGSIELFTRVWAEETAAAPPSGSTTG